MYGICSTKKNDVRDCIIAMKKKGYMCPILQFQSTTYKKIKEDPPNMLDNVNKTSNHVINMNTMRIHKKSCRYKGSNIIGARIINVKRTGLQSCRHCMK